MKAQKKSLISALLAITVTCIALASALFVAPTFKTVIAIDNTATVIDFSNSSDIDNFTAVGTSKGSVSNGVYNPVGWTPVYYNTAIDMNSNTYITFDFCVSESSSYGMINVGLIRPEVIDGTAKVYVGDSYTETTCTIETEGAGINFNTLNGSAFMETSLAQYGWLKSIGSLASDFKGTVHTVAITINNKNVSFEFDGTEVYNTKNNLNTTFNDRNGKAIYKDTDGTRMTVEDLLTDTVYLAFKTDNNDTYIDNLIIENNFDRKYSITASDKDFSLLDKKSNITGASGGYGAFIDKDVNITDEITSGQYERRGFYNCNQYNLFGADYYTFKVDNQTGNYVTFALDFAEGNSSGYGAWWTAAEGMPYYMQYENGTVKQGVIKQYNLNRGVMTLPIGFKGTVIFPFTSVERMGWGANDDRVAGHSDDESAINLSQISWVDVYYFETATCKDGGYIKVSDEQIWGDYISSVPNSVNRVKNAINNIGTVTLASESQIAFARTQYDALTDKSELNDYLTVLTKAEEDFASLTDKSYMVGADGKNFEGTDGVAFGEVFTKTPSTLSAWVKVSRSTADDTHVGTVIGNMSRFMIADSTMYDDINVFSFEITTNGNPKLIWRVSRTEKVVFLVKNVDVRTGSYVNVTFVRDVENAKLICYINGTAVATKNVSASQIADLTFVNLPVMVGNDYRNDEVLCYGYHPDFAGYIADVSVYSFALTAEEVASNMSGVRAENLLGAIDFASGEANEYYDEVNSNATDAYVWKEINGISDLELGDYSMAILGDTQMMLSMAKDANGNDLYNQNYDKTSNVFYKNVSWLAENKDALNLKFVMHVGDLTDNLNYSVYNTKGTVEMAYGLENMDVLSAAGIPWSLARGNHDGGYESARLAVYDGGSYNSEGVWEQQDFSYSLYSANGASGTATEAKTHYGYNAENYGLNSDRITSLIASGAINEFGASDNNLMHNTYYKFTVGEVKWMVLTIDLEPSTADIEWAKGIIEKNTDHKVIITTHAYLNSNGKLLNELMGDSSKHNNGQYIWDNLASKYANIAMVVCGHVSAENIVQTKLIGENGNEVLNVTVDESAHEYIGNKQYGPFVILGFSNNGKTVAFNFYSASQNKLFRSVNQFTVELNDVVTTESEDDDETPTWPSDAENIVVMPNIRPFSVLSSGQLSTTTEQTGASATLQFTNASGTQFRSLWQVYAVSIDISEKGIFKFSADAGISSTWCARIAMLKTSAKDGLTRIIKLTDPVDTDSLTVSNGIYGGNTSSSSEYSLKFADVVPDGINVEVGDKITILYSGNGSDWVYVCFDGAVYGEDGNLVKEYTLGIKPNTTNTTAIEKLYAAGYNGKLIDGTDSSIKNYNGFTAGWLHLTGSFANFFTKYTNTVTVTDENGATLFTAVAGSMGSGTGGQSKLPTLYREGYKFNGYKVNNVVYGGNEFAINGTTNADGTTQTVVALFEKIVTNDIVICDTDGKQVVVIESGFTGTLPELSRSGRIFLGYLVDGSLYKTYSYTGNEESVQAVFAKFSTYNGASMRITTPTGIRFRTFIDGDVLTLIGANNVAFGTLICNAEDITANGIIDYSKLTVETSVKHLDIVATDEGMHTVGNYTYFNGAVTSIKDNHYDWKFAGLGYMTVTYADGSTQTYYAGVTDSARSAAEIAKNAYNDVRLVKTNAYDNAVDGGYSAYDADTREMLAGFFGGNN